MLPLPLWLTMIRTSLPCSISRLRLARRLPTCLTSSDEETLIETRLKEKSELFPDNSQLPLNLTKTWPFTSLEERLKSEELSQASRLLRVRSADLMFSWTPMMMKSLEEETVSLLSTISWVSPEPTKTESVVKSTPPKPTLTAFLKDWMLNLPTATELNKWLPVSRATSLSFRAALLESIRESLPSMVTSEDSTPRLLLFRLRSELWMTESELPEKRDRDWLTLT